MKKLGFLLVLGTLGMVAFSQQPSSAVCSEDSDTNLSLDRESASAQEAFASTGPATADSEFKVEFKIADVGPEPEGEDLEEDTETSASSTSDRTVPVNERQFASRAEYLDAIAYELNNCSQ